MTRDRRIAGAGLALALAFHIAAAVAAAPTPTTDRGAPLPDAFRRALSGEDPTASARYKAVVFGRLAASNHVGTKTKGLPGAAGIHFVVNALGVLVRAEVTRPSGNPTFDANALAMVRKAAPFPPPPVGAKRDFDATIRFSPGPKP